jgi:hypothetical protein
VVSTSAPSPAGGTATPASADPPAEPNAAPQGRGGFAAHSPIQHVPASQPRSGQPWPGQSCAGWSKARADQAVTRISRVARTPQTLAQAMAQGGLHATAGTNPLGATATASASVTPGAEDDTHHSAQQTAALLRQAIVSFTAGGSANLAPSQAQDSSEKATISTGHVGHS